MKKKARSTHSSPVLEVTARDFHHYDKNHFWYLGIGVLLLAVLVGAIQARNYTLAVLAPVIGLAVFRLAGLHPKSQTARFSQRGIEWGGQIIPYHQFRSFWLAQTTAGITLYLERLNYQPVMNLLLSETDAAQAADLLFDHLPWHAHKTESVPDRLARWLRL